MSYIKIVIGKDLSSIDQTFRSSIDAMFRMNPLFPLGQHAWCPQTDIYETSQEIIITCELAGVRLEDLHVETDRRALKVCGVRRERRRQSDGSYLLAEIPSGYFEGLFPLPSPIDLDTVKASYADGLLQINLQKISLNHTHNFTVRSL